MVGDLLIVTERDSIRGPSLQTAVSLAFHDRDRDLSAVPRLIAPFLSPSFSLHRTCVPAYLCRVYTLRVETELELHKRVAIGQEMK